jgi:glycosyltransferase involved in cell wall biosynthesis
MSKPVVMMHYVLPDQLGGPNVAFDRICSSALCLKYEFVPLVQDRVAGGRINLGLILDLYRKIRNVKPDIVHISGLQSAGFHCICAAKLAKCKLVVVTIHGFNGSVIELSPIKRWVFNNIVEPLTLCFADAVHCISEYVSTRPMVVKYAKGKTFCVYNYPPNATRIAEGTNIRNKLNINTSDVVVVTVARVVLDKGFYELAKAIHSLDDIPNIKFVVIGDGAYRSQFEDSLHDVIRNNRVIMLGQRDDVLEIMNECDFFVLPTLHENLGNVFLEASLVKKALIGTNVGGIPEIIIDKKNGLLIPAGDSEKLADAIRFLYDNPEIRLKYGVEAYNRLTSVFSVDDITNKYDELYQSLLRTRIFDRLDQT